VSEEIFLTTKYLQCIVGIVHIFEETEMRKRIFKEIEQRTEERQREGEYSIEKGDIEREQWEHNSEKRVRRQKEIQNGAETECIATET
jgi:hypothetical protein